MFRDRRRLRRWATQVLLVWLFGIGAGIAHACMLRIADHPHGVASPAVTQHQHAAATLHEHSDQAVDVDEQGNCVDFCEKSSMTAPSSSVKHDQGGDMHPTAILASPAPWAVCWASTGDAPPGSACPDRGGFPPPRIAFQRLSL